MRYAKNDFDSMRFCMYLIDMHYSNNLKQQFWNMVQQQVRKYKLKSNFFILTST
jgi:hypothetical protein